MKSLRAAGLSKFLFGYDIFISYAYKDGKEYAQALEDKLANLDFSCFLDKKELPYGNQLTSSLGRAIHRSKALLLVGTQGAVDAPYVKLELVEALTKGRTKVIPVDVDGIRERFDLRELRDLPWINEDRAAARARSPSSAMLDAIASHFRFTRRNTIARRFIAAAGAFFFLLSVVAGWQWRVAVAQRDTAMSRELAAQSKLLVDAKPDTALLVASEAARIRDTFEARDALLGALGSRPGLDLLLHDAGTVSDLAFSPDGRFLLSAMSNAQATIWDLASNPPSRRAANPGETEAYARAPDADDDRVRRLLESISEAGARMRRHAVTPDRKLLAASDGERVTLWHIATRKRIGEPRSAQSRYVRALAFSPDGNTLASGSSAGTIAIWHVAVPPPIGRALAGLDVSANSVAFSSDATKVAAGDYNGEVLVWGVDTGQPIGSRLVGHSSPVSALRFCADNKQLVSVASEVIRRNLESGQPVGTAAKLPEHAEVAISPDCRVVALGANDGQVRFLDIETGELRRPARNEHGDRTFALAFSPDGNTLASSGNDRRIVLWDVRMALPSGAPLEGHTAPIAGLDFSADGERLASLDSDGTMFIWDMRTSQRLGLPLQRGEQYTAYSALALSPDARTAATALKEGVVSLWDVATWRPLGRPLPGHPGGVVAMRFSPGGEWLVSASLGGSVILWDLRSESWIAAARRMANRSLRADERTVYLGSADAPSR